MHDILVDAVERQIPRFGFAQGLASANVQTEVARALVRFTKQALCALRSW